MGFKIGDIVKVALGQEGLYLRGAPYYEILEVEHDAVTIRTKGDGLLSIGMNLFEKEPKKDLTKLEKVLYLNK